MLNLKSTRVVLLVPILIALLLAAYLLFWRATPPIHVRSFPISTNLGLSGRMVLLPNGHLAAADFSTLFILKPDGQLASQTNLRTRGSLALFQDLAIRPDGTVVAMSIQGPKNQTLVGFRDGRITWEIQGEFPSIPGSLPLFLDDQTYCFGRSNFIHCVHTNGAELWRFPTEGRMYRPPALAPDGGLLFVDYTKTNSSLVMLNRDGTLRWRQPAPPPYSRGPLFAPDGSFWLGMGTNITLAAFDSLGNLRWTLDRPEFALSEPVHGPDQTIYLTARAPGQDPKLLAVDPTGKLKWTFPLGWGHALEPPAVDDHGNLYLATADRRVYAISPEGRLLWKYKIPPKPRIIRTRTPGGFTRQWREWFGLRKNESHGPPLITSNQVLYINYTHDGTIYAFDLNHQTE